MSKQDHNVVLAQEEPRKKSFMGILAPYLSPQSQPSPAKATGTQSSH